MDELLTLANEPVKIVIGGKQRLVRQLSMFDLASVRRDIVDCLKATRRKDIEAVASMCPPADRAKVLMEALRTIAPTEDEIASSMSTGEGLGIVIAKALRCKPDEAKALMDDPDEAAGLQKAFQVALDVKDEPPQQADGESAGTPEGSPPNA